MTQTAAQVVHTVVEHADRPPVTAAMVGGGVLMHFMHGFDPGYVSAIYFSFLLPAAAVNFVSFTWKNFRRVYTWMKGRL